MSWWAEAPADVSEWALHLLRGHHNEVPAERRQRSTTGTKGDKHHGNDSEGGISYQGQTVLGGPPSLKHGEEYHQHAMAEEYAYTRVSYLDNSATTDEQF